MLHSDRVRLALLNQQQNRAVSRYYPRCKLFEMVKQVNIFAH